MQRNLINDEVFNAIKYWQGMGKPVVVDLDDAYHILPWSNPAHKFWIEKNDGNNIDILEYGLSICNGLIAPNRLLLSDWAHVTKGYYIQNYSDLEWWENLKSREEIKAERNISDKIVIGWGGSMSHYDSFYGSGIFDAAKSISYQYPDVLWMICGNDDRLFEVLPVPERQKIWQPGVPPEQWPQIIKTFDIGIAPLYGPYDQRRSWIKGLEYLHAGVPWIGTIGEPYKEFEKMGLGILIENGANNWEKSIAHVLENLKSYQQKAAERVELSKQWHTINQIDTYDYVYRKIIQDFRDENGMLPGVIYVKAE